MLSEESHCSIATCGREVEGHPGSLEGDGGDGRLEAHARMDLKATAMGGKRETECAIGHNTIYVK